MSAWPFSDPRRRAHPRIPTDALCMEIDDQRERHARVVNVSPDGLRIQRPTHGWRSPIVQLEFEIPGIDEVMWASGDCRFEDSFPLPQVTPVCIPNVVSESGIQLRATTRRHQRMLEEFVVETWRATQAPVEYDWLDRAGCYMRG